MDLLTYTVAEMEEQLALIELHAKEYSTDPDFCVDCASKHLSIMEGLAKEGIEFAEDEETKQLFSDIASQTRKWRKQLFYPEENPGAKRKYEPYAWTECELAHPKVQAKMRRCIKKVEKKIGLKFFKACQKKARETGKPLEELKIHGKTCYNPYAICRASVKCP